MVKVSDEVREMERLNDELRQSILEKYSESDNIQQHTETIKAGIKAALDDLTREKLRKDIQIAVAKVNVLTEQEAEKTATIGELEVQIADRNATLATLQSSHGDNETSKQERDAAIATLESTVASQTKELGELSQCATELEADLLKKYARKDELESLIKEYKEEMEARKIHLENANPKVSTK